MGNSYAYQQITDRIIAMLEQGTIPWAKALADQTASASEYAFQTPVQRDQLLSSCLFRLPFSVLADDETGQRLRRMRPERRKSDPESFSPK